MSLDSSATYKYRILFVDESGNESDYIEITTTTGVADVSMDLTNLPTIFDGFTGIRRRFYRTEGNGSTFKYLLDDAGTTTSKNDAVADGSLGATYAAPSSQTYNSSVVYSEIQKVSTISTTIEDVTITSLLPIFPDDGDVLTGLVEEEGRVIVFKKNSIRQIITDGNPLNWRVETITDRIGSDTPLSIKRAKDKIYFMSHNQIYRYPDYMNVPISQPKVNTFNSATAIVDSNYISSEGWYCIIITISTSQYIMVYDEKAEAWYTFRADNYDSWYTITEKEYGSTRGTILVGGVGFVFKYNESTKLDYDDVSNSENVTALFKTKTFTSNDPTYEFRLRKLFADYKKTDGIDVVHLLTNPQDGVTLTNTDSTDSTISSDYKNYEKVTDAMTGTLRVVNKVNYQVTGWDEFNAFRLQYIVVNHGRR